MKRDKKFYYMLLGISILAFILEVFVFKFQRLFGLLLCIFSLYFIVGSIIRIVRLSKIFNDDILKMIDILFL